MKIEEGIRIIVQCAKLYERNLLDKQLLIVYGKEQKHIESMEIEFRADNFKHLTGVELSHNVPAERFFKLALKSKLSKKDIFFKKDGTTVMKLDVLPHTMQIHQIARMVGDYNETKTFLHTEKIAGTTSLSLGFIHESNDTYIPNTVLKEDVRNVTNKPQQRILAMYIKDKDAQLYSEQTYLAANVNITKFPQQVLDKLEPAEYLLKI